MSMRELFYWMLALASLLIGSASIIFRPWDTESIIIGLVYITCGIGLLLVSRED